MSEKQNKFSIGADIEEIGRFNQLDRKKNKIFLSRIFTAKELKYCFSKPRPGQHLAGRFVAKEAVYKALVAAGEYPVPLKKIEILANMNGIPRVRVDSHKIIRDFRINLSISHCSSWAIALALVEKYEKN